MSVLKFPGGEGPTDEGPATAEAMFEAFGEFAAADDSQSPAEAVVVYLSGGGLVIGGNINDPEGVNLLLDMAKYAIMSRCFGETIDEETPYSVH